MAKLSLDLLKFKAAGVYTVEIDSTQEVTVDTNALRLLVGFNPVGPFNKPVFLADDSDRIATFGDDVDTKLEKKGSYFNRMAKTLLQRGPIFALNLLPVDDTVNGPDQVNYAALSLNAAKPNPEVASARKTKFGETDYTKERNKTIYGEESSLLPYIGNAPYASFYDRTRFWTPDNEKLLSVAALGLDSGDTTSFERTNFLNFANISTNEMSILVFKPENVSGYDITAKEWYGGKQNIPYGFIRPNDYISDYFIQVVAVQGNWSNYSQLSTDTLWADFFDQKGILKNKINNFISTEGVTLIGSWSGCIIPDFVNKVGEHNNIIEKINNNTMVTGLLASFNVDAANSLAFDYDGKEDADGKVDPKTRGWFIDNDGDFSWNTSESGVNDSTYMIDMVGHEFSKGYHADSDDDDAPRRYAIDFLSYNYSADSADELVVSIKHAKKFSECGVDGNGNAPTGTDIKNMFIIANKEEADKLIIGDLVKNDETDMDIIPGLTKITKKVYLPFSDYEDSVSFSDTLKLDQETVQVKNAHYTYNGIEYTYSGEAIKDNNFQTVGVYLFTALEPVAIDAAAPVKVLAAYDGDGAVQRKDDLTKELVEVTNAIVDNENYLMTPKQEVKVSVIDPSINDEAGVTADSKKVNVTVELSNKFDLSKLKGYVIDQTIETPDQTLADNASSKAYLKVTVDGNDNYVSADNPHDFAVSKSISVDSAIYYKADETVANSSTFEEYMKLKTVIKVNGVPDNVDPAVKDDVLDELNDISQFTIGNTTANIDTWVNNEAHLANKDAELTDPLVDLLRQIVSSKVKLTVNSVSYTLDGVQSLIKQHKISDNIVSKSLKFLPMKGLKLSKRHMPGYDANGNVNAEAGVEKIYKMLADEGIKRGLCNPEMIDYRYVIDSMGYGIAPMMGGKVYLSQLAMERGKCLAILNAPSKKEFERSTNPYFCDTFVNGVNIKPGFSTKYIPEGGNKELYAGNLFSLPDLDNGATFTGVFWPWLTYTDNGKSINVPPAADVANAFIRKFQGSDPYKIVANREGILYNGNLAGVEYQADVQDRNYLEPFGINTIISKNDDVMIYGNQTAYQRVKSDLNKLHVRDNLNSIEIECEAVLQRYVFKYNTAQTRADIVSQLTPILSVFQNAGAIETFDIVCDDSNNTEDVISNDYMVADISVVMNHGAEKIVQRITLKRNSVSQN